MPVPPIFGCTNIFQARILGEHKLNNAWFDVADKTVLIISGWGHRGLHGNSCPTPVLMLQWLDGGWTCLRRCLPSVSAGYLPSIFVKMVLPQD